MAESSDILTTVLIMFYTIWQESLAFCHETRFDATLARSSTWLSFKTEHLLVIYL